MKLRSGVGSATAPAEFPMLITSYRFYRYNIIIIFCSSQAIKRALRIPACRCARIVQTLLAPAQPACSLPCRSVNYRVGHSQGEVDDGNFTDIEIAYMSTRVETKVRTFKAESIIITAQHEFSPSSTSTL